MKKISVVYFTESGAIASLVDSAISEIKSFGCEVFSHAIQGSEIIEGRFSNTEIFSELETSNAIIFASPTYMGGVAAQFKAFADATSDIWCNQAWSGKLAAGITCGTAPNGDQSSTLQYLTIFASQHGMLWAGLDSAFGYIDHGVNRFGCQLGVVAQLTNNLINEADLKTAQYLGARIVSLL